MRFGLHGGKAQTLDQVGNELGVTRESARRIIIRAQESARYIFRNRMARVSPYLNSSVRLPLHSLPVRY